MAPDAESICIEFKAFYSSTLINRNVSQSFEANCLRVLDSTVSNYLSFKSPDRNLPIALAAVSEVGDELAAWLAQKRGGLFVKLAGERDGNHRKELRAILQAVADLQVETDEAKIERLLQTIAKNAEHAILDKKK